jgi:hypothetical protein
LGRLYVDKGEATSSEVLDLRMENAQLKHLVADLTLDNEVLGKSHCGLADERPGLAAERRAKHRQRGLAGAGTTLPPPR